MEDLDSSQAVALFGEEICQPNSLVSIVLRAHLKIEAEADRLIRLMCVKPESLDTTRLTASQKFRLCEALWGNPDGDSDFWQALQGLNALRNEMAHGLRQGALERKLRAFIATIAQDESGSAGQALEDSLVNCLCYLYHDMTVLEHCCSRT
jgi:hypothetical protein